MSKLYKFSELSKDFTPERWREIEIETEKLRTEWGLPETPDEYQTTDDDIAWDSPAPAAENYRDVEMIDDEASEAKHPTTHN